MSLYIPLNDFPEASIRDLETLFQKFKGFRNCVLKGSYAFINFFHEREADDALREVNDTTFFWKETFYFLGASEGEQQKI